MSCGAIRVVVSYTDGHGTAETVTSGATAAVANVNDAPTGGGDDHRHGDRGPDADGASSTLADADGLGTCSYQWQRERRGFVDVGRTRRPTRSARPMSAHADPRGGRTTPTATARPESVASAATAAVANVNDAPTGAVTITGTATEDQMLTARTRWPMPTVSARSLPVAARQRLGFREGRLGSGAATSGPLTLGSARRIPTSPWQRPTSAAPGCAAAIPPAPSDVGARIRRHLVERLGSIHAGDAVRGARRTTCRLPPSITRPCTPTRRSACKA